MFGTISLFLALIFLVISALFYLRLAGGHAKSLRVGRISYYTKIIILDIWCYITSKLHN